MKKEKITKEKLQRMMKTQMKVERGLRKMLSDVSEKNVKLSIENEHLRDIMETNYTADSIIKKWRKKSQQKIENVECGEWVCLDPPLCKWALAEVLQEATEEYNKVKNHIDELRE